MEAAERNALDDVTGRGRGLLTDVRVAGTMATLERTTRITKGVDECQMCLLPSLAIYIYS
jgi:hypothetical protein